MNRLVALAALLIPLATAQAFTVGDSNSVSLAEHGAQYGTQVGVREARPLWFYCFDRGTNKLSLTGLTARYYWTDQSPGRDVTYMTNILGSISGNKITFSPTTNTFKSLIEGPGYSEIKLTDTNGASLILARGTHQTIAAPSITVTEPFQANIIVNWANYTFTNGYASGPVLIRWGTAWGVSTSAAGRVTYTMNTNATSTGGSATNVTAAAVSYAGNATYSNVQDALDGLLYAAPTVSLSGGSIYDNGRVITNVSLTWTANKAMTTRVLSNGATATFGAGGSGSYTVTNALDAAATTYTLTVGDGAGTSASSTVNYFRDRRYWGWATNATLTDAQVRALTSELATARTTSKTGLTPTGNQYLWMCYPASWGDGYFILGAYPTDFVVSTNSFTNAYGYAASYILNRSPNLIGYATTLEVQ